MQFNLFQDNDFIQALDIRVKENHLHTYIEGIFLLGFITIHKVTICAYSVHSYTKIKLNVELTVIYYCKCM